VYLARTIAHLPDNEARQHGELGTMLDDRWPQWARDQLLSAVALAASARTERLLAAELYERWFSGAVRPDDTAPRRPLVGEYRRAHAGVGTSIVDGVPVLDRNDRIGSDGWWRTWNTTWRPRSTTARVLLTPQAEANAALVGELTSRLRDVPYVLAAPTDSARLATSGSVVLYVPRLSTLSPDLVTALGPLLRPDSPPLCLPVAPGVAVAQYPDNGMTFGEHRCHLVAIALRSSFGDQALSAIADVFSAHGVDPAAPYRTAPGMRAESL
jgi:hypothetical protein